MSASYYPQLYPDYAPHHLASLVSTPACHLLRTLTSPNQPEYPTIIADADYVDPQIPTPPTSATFTLSDLSYYQQSPLSYFDQFAGAYDHSSGSDYTESPPSTGYMPTPTLVQSRPRQMRGVRPDPSPMALISETDPIPSIRRASQPSSPLALTPPTTVPSSPATQAPSHIHDDAYFHPTRLHTSPFAIQAHDGYRSSSSTPTPSPTLSPTSDEGYSSQLKHDFRRRRADRRRSKLLEIASVLPFRATDP